MRRVELLPGPSLGLLAVVMFACGTSATSPAIGGDGDTIPDADGGGPGSDTGVSGPTPDAGSSPDGTTGIDAGSSPDGTTGIEAGPPLADPCIEAGTCPPGVWIDVTPSNANITAALDCSNYGTQSVQTDPLMPGVLYAQFMCQGVWKSSDYGMTWTGPINTGTGGAAAGDAAGGITLPQGAGATEPPTIYSVGIRGNGLGFWKSTNGGVDWTNYTIGAPGSRQDYYPVVVDPYDATHLLMAGHENNVAAESTDGGQTWSQVPLVSGMMEQGGTGGIFFMDTGTASTTRTTWLWMAQQSGGLYGTWSTTNGGTAWNMVDKNEHPHGASQIYQPNTAGAVFMAGAYSDLGWGVLGSTDYGQTWTHYGVQGANETVVFGMIKNVYVMMGGAAGVGQVVNPTLQSAPQPGTGTWTSGTTPSTMTQGPGQVAVATDATGHSVAVAACFNAGLWRYLEP